MKIIVLGYTGMLGTYVYSHLKEKGYEVQGFNRDDLDIAESTLNEQILRSFLFHKGVKKDDVIINCMGAIKPMVDKYGTLPAIKVNSLFPHILANACENEDYKLIHITTDCVFTGDEGQYTEESPHDCKDVYGKTKSLGEPENCTVIRTSIIGEENGTSRSLIEWVKSQDGKTVYGYTNHQWNGLTCYQAAKVFEQIISEDLYWEGVRHIHSPNSLNKHQLVFRIAQAHGLNIEVTPTDGPTKCDRTLLSVYPDNVQLFNIPNIMAQLTEQSNLSR